MRSLHSESGFSLVELLVVCSITTVLMGALATIFGLGLNTSKTSNSFIASQGGVQIALDRLDYEARCASSAKLVSGGAGVTLTFPSQCTHASSTATWCVTGGSLVRYVGTSCSGSSQTLTSNVTSTTPFSCLATVGVYPALKAILTVNTGTKTATAFTGSDTITLENAVLTTSSSAACS